MFAYTALFFHIIAIYERIESILWQNKKKKQCKIHNKLNAENTHAQVLHIRIVPAHIGARFDLVVARLA